MRRRECLIALSVAFAGCLGSGSRRPDSPTEEVDTDDQGGEFAGGERTTESTTGTTASFPPIDQYRIAIREAIMATRASHGRGGLQINGHAASTIADVAEAHADSMGRADEVGLDVNGNNVVAELAAQDVACQIQRDEAAGMHEGSEVVFVARVPGDPLLDGPEASASYLLDNWMSDLDRRRVLLARDAQVFGLGLRFSGANLFVTVIFC